MRQPCASGRELSREMGSVGHQKQYSHALLLAWGKFCSKHRICLYISGSWTPANVAPTQTLAKRTQRLSAGHQ